MRILKCGVYYVNVYKKQLLYKVTKNDVDYTDDCSDLVKDFRMFLVTGCDIDGDAVYLVVDKIKGAYFTKMPCNGIVLYVEDVLHGDENHLVAIINNVSDQKEKATSKQIAVRSELLLKDLMKVNFTRSEALELVAAAMKTSLFA